MNKKTMWIALIVSWLLTAGSIALVVHLRAQNRDQAERIRRFEAANNLLAIAKGTQIYRNESFDAPPKPERDGEP